MSRNNDSLPMLPPWLSESDVTQVGYEAPVENLPQDDLIDEAPKRRRFMSRGGNDDAKKDKRGRRRRGEDQQLEQPAPQRQPEPTAERGNQRPPAERQQSGWGTDPLNPGEQPNTGWQGGPNTGAPEAPSAGPGMTPPWPQEQRPPYSEGPPAVPQPPAPGPSAHAPTHTGPTGASFTHTAPPQHGGPSSASPHIGHTGSPEAAYADPTATPSSHGGPISASPHVGQTEGPAAYTDPTIAQGDDRSGPALPTRTPAPPSTGFTPLGPGQRQLPDLPPPPPLPDPPARPRPTEAPPRLTAPAEPPVGHADPLLGPTATIDSPAPSTGAGSPIGAPDPLLGPLPTSTVEPPAPSTVGPASAGADLSTGANAPAIGVGSSAGAWSMPDEAAAELRSPDAEARPSDGRATRRLPDPADSATASATETQAPRETDPSEPREQAGTGGRHSLDQPESAAPAATGPAIIGDHDPRPDATRTPPRLPEPPARLSNPSTSDTALSSTATHLPSPADDAALTNVPVPQAPSDSAVSTGAYVPSADDATPTAQAPAEATTRLALPTDLIAGTPPDTANTSAASSQPSTDSGSAYTAGGSTGGASPYRSGEPVAPPQPAPGPDHSPYVPQTPTYDVAQYNSVPGDPSPGAQFAPDAQTEMFRPDDPRVQAARNQAPGGDSAQPTWQSTPEQQPYSQQSGYRSGEFAQPGTPVPPYQQAPAQFQPGDPAQQFHHQPDGSTTPPYQQGEYPRPDGTPPQHYAQPDGSPAPPHQSPDSAATRHYQQADGAAAQSHQRPDGAAPQQFPPQYQPDGSPAPQFLPDGTPAPQYQRPDGAPYQPGDVAPQQFQGGPTAQPYQQQAPGQYRQPGQYQQPGWGANPQQGYQPPSLDNVPVKRVKKAPGSGWRKAVHHVSGGAINPGMSAEERRLQELVARIRQPVRGDYRIAVLSLKGGVGKTTTTTGLGSIFASIRGDRVIAVDANPDFGTLSQRVALQTRSTVRDLLLDPSIERYSDVRRHTSQSSSRLEVLASERDPAASESFNDEEYRAVARILQRFYNIILTDCGTGLMHSAMSGVLDLAHSLVLISSAAIDGARSAAATLDWLSLHGHDHLVRNAVVVINLPREGSPNVGVQQLREYFLSRCRAVHIIPFDEHLSEGAEIDLHRLHKTTKRAYVELAATVADEFGVDHHRFG
ncbi:AAA family ATPase [Nocardia sp. NPDC060259]|uniref:MinD/ParA family ATP-binding protein n=1 Tax=Nocardia sp. NPDC060259 TaxID=3347088 RepID=UPI00365D3D1A